jgi:hypothetical protein
MQTGLDTLLHDEARLARLKKTHVALLANPASMTGVHSGFEHALDALVARLGPAVTAAFGPQHGMRGDKQYNMEESPTYRDGKHGIPVFSLYGDVRRPTDEMVSHFDVLLFDLQDVGWRGYTWVATLLYVLEACAKAGKAVWVLDRPNPAGRTVEGKKLVVGEESFVGVMPIPQRHGLTLGECFMVDHFDLDGSRVVPMGGIRPRKLQALVGRGPRLDQPQSGNCQHQQHSMLHGHGVTRRTNLSEVGGRQSARGGGRARPAGELAGAHEKSPAFCEGAITSSSLNRSSTSTRQLCAGVRIMQTSLDTSRQVPSLPTDFRAVQVVANRRTSSYGKFLLRCDPTGPIDVITAGRRCAKWWMIPCDD